MIFKPKKKSEGGGFKLHDARAPELLCIGAQKAGTSWFHTIFGDRPDVWIPPYKELHFFDYKFVEANKGWIGPHRERGIAAARKRYKKANPDYLLYLERTETGLLDDLNWYKDVFRPAAPNQIALDVTPEYSCIPDEGVAYIAKHLPNTKFIYIVRDPLDRAVSQLKMNVSRKFQEEEPNNWLQEGKNRVLLNRGNYQQYIPRWDNAFDRDRLLFLPFGKIKQDPIGLLRQVERFMGMEERVYEKAERVIHKTPEIAVPQEVVKHLERVLKPQYLFLNSYFSKEFVAAIK